MILGELTQLNIQQLVNIKDFKVLYLAPKKSNFLLSFNFIHSNNV